MKRVPTIFSLVLLLHLVFTMSAYAQTCKGLTILKASQANLDAGSVCDAATPLIKRGHQVYIFVTDAKVPTEQAWFDIRDKIETDWGIYDSASDIFSNQAVAIEISTDTSKPWGQDLAIGDALYKAPLDDKQVVGGIEGKMKNDAMSGDVTIAIVNGLKTTYSLGYPPATATPKPAPTTVIVTGPTTNVQVDTKPVVGFIGNLLLLLVGLAILYAIVRYLAIPFFNNLMFRRRLAEHVAELKKHLVSLMTASEGLLKGEGPENTLLFALWQSNGGDKYKEPNKEVLESLRRSQVALGKIYEVWLGLQHAPAPKGNTELQERVKACETIYLTIVGNDPEILKLTEDEQMALLDPMVVLPRETTDVQLVQQVDALLRQQHGAGNLMIDLTLVKPEDFDKQGILGYVNQVKKALLQLNQAREAGPESLKKVREARQTVETTFVVPEVLTGQHIFTYLDKLIEQATAAESEQRWLDVVDAADKAAKALETLPILIAAFAAAYAASTNKQKQITAIVDKGYRLTQEVTAALAEVAQDIVSIRDAIADGNYTSASEFVTELEADSQRALDLLSQIVNLREANEQQLLELAKEVARVDTYRTQSVEPDWQVLQQYPQSNSQPVASFVDDASKILIALFDDPANETDTASTIGRANSFEEQRFTEAQTMIASAFAQLHDAETKLKAVVAKLSEVKQIEASVEKLSIDVSSAIDKAIKRRNQDDVKIDTNVDQLILQAQDIFTTARTAITARNFIEAQSALTNALQSASKAYASADEQADRIDKLYSQLTETKKESTDRVTQSNANLHALSDVVRTRQAKNLVAQAQELFQEAQRLENAIGGEDVTLASSLAKAVDAYEDAEEIASKAISQIQSDQRVYNGEISSTRDTLDLAAREISDASRYVNDDDAGQAGSEALRKAQQGIPAQPHSNMTIEELQRLRAQAEQSQESAARAKREAQSRINQVEAARAAERTRQAAIEAAAAQAARQAAQERARQRPTYSPTHTSTMGSSHRPSSMSSSPMRSSSSMGSTRGR